MLLNGRVNKQSVCDLKTFELNMDQGTGLIIHPENKTVYLNDTMVRKKLESEITPCCSVKSNQ